ncbi:MAG: hypothetical protein CSA34_06955 [Desulfobulbus propionicus]|nr:MAG: hypothetical protein CSA34_06955 [Desulfobulbus propionicus]
MRCLPVVYCAVFIGLLWIPTLQHSLGVLPQVELIGAEPPVPQAELTATAWFTGAFQRQYEQRRNIRFGLRPHLVKSYNQLQYSLFGRVTSGTGTSVIIGDDRWLYERTYVAKLNKPSADDGTLISTRVRQLRRLQDQLKARKKAFAYIIAPSKAEVYPEFIPSLDWLRPPLQENQETDYQQAVKALQQHGVHFVDCHALFARQKKENPALHLFGPGGIHWNKYGVYLAWQELAALLNTQMSQPVRLPPLKAVERRRAEPVEADLGRLLNLWDPVFISRATDYPVFHPQKSQDHREKPSFLIIGDSFLFTLVAVMAEARLSEEVDALYYFKRSFHYPADNGTIDPVQVESHSIQGEPLDWDRLLLHKDAVILLSTEYWLPELGWGFVEAASGALEERRDQGK